MEYDSEPEGGEGPVSYTHLDVYKRQGDAEIVITNKTPISSATMEKCPNIRYIGVLATGYNVVDTEAARKRDIAVSNIPTYGTDAVGQLSLIHISKAKRQPSSAAAM